MSSERQLLIENDPWWGEHVHRYQEVLKHLKGAELILDIACGTGFGSNILAQKTTGMVTGGDIAVEAIRECAATWHRSNLAFAVLDGTNLAFPDEYFDIVVSFETIEHTTMYREMLREFLRVVKKGGTIFISTPNFAINSPSGKVTNPYHTQEFTLAELTTLLKEVFPEPVIMGQKYSRYDHSVPRIGKMIEWIFNVKGIRKTPYKVKNGLMKFFIKKPFYPTDDDFSMISSTAEILACKTFFCICKK